MLGDAKNEKDRITKASVAARLKPIKSDLADERKMLTEYLTLDEKNGAILDQL